MIETIFILVALCALTWYIADGLKARETGVAAAKDICQKEGLQFLDDSVIQQGMRLARHENGRLGIQRTFGFEYSDTGNNRRPGTITLLGSDITMIYTGPSQDSLPAIRQDQIG